MKKIPWGPIRSSLTNNFSFGVIKEIIGYTSIDMALLAHLEQKPKDGASKSQLLSAIDCQIGQMNAEESGSVASICCEEVLIRKPELSSELDRVLARVGWKFSGTTLLPVEIFDISELREIPEKAHEDILKAASRLRDGDLSGSLSASCGALDSVTSMIYEEYGLGDPNSASFQERINKSIEAVGAKESLIRELQEINWVESDYKPLEKNLSGSLNQAAFIMQKLRSNMGDVHGTKPVVTALVYDSIKWSLLILRIIVTRGSF
ncbi:Uncharacterised protein [Zhongshania aliphaticivorans]|uniref:Abortive infection protein-like C-terminal domain-containing protein n=1 Tax=Zhongshania aliphaticivorans TaxID=1470434 RepID=A0A5S9N9S4_9GAMM|nr:hypothetical protein [Zhongshania aliphaticivorans]CAA0078952.1 Uncharacterised protein [Zhongshania aliphaticivorans]CAA0086440.1 Uncharacterised protein [Zhongshania aliphaticivorans]